MIKDLIELKFGRLTVIKLYSIHQRYTNNGAKNGKYYYLCKCDCGNEVIVEKHNLTSGNTKSCGCFNYDKIMERCYKHHGCNEKLYSTYRGMLQRCNCKTHKYYKDYGGRGIKVCDEWRDYNNFRSWSINNGYNEGLSIDRINNNGNYEPNNCRWVDMQQQANNRRNNKLLTYNNETLTMAQWSRKIGISSTTLHARISAGWSIERAIITPLKNSII